MHYPCVFLLSGVTAISTGSATCFGLDKFSVNINSTSFGSNVATGTVNILGRLDNNDIYTTLYSNNFNNNSGVLVQFDGPFNQIRATLNPMTTGTFTVAMKYSKSHK